MNRKMLPVVLLWMLSLAGRAQPYEGAAGGDTAPVSLLEQVVVTGTRTPHALKETPVLTRVVPRALLLDMGAESVLDALENLVPGLTFNPDPNHGDNIQLLGLDNQYILVLLNGERMVNGRAGNVNFSRLQVADIERIELIEGAASALYGSSAIGAVINIITKAPAAPVEVGAGSRYGSYNSYAAHASAGFRGAAWSSKTLLSARGTDGWLVEGSTAQGRAVARRVSPSDDYYIGQTFTFGNREQGHRLLGGATASACMGQLWPYGDVVHRREVDWRLGAYLDWHTGAGNRLSIAVHTDRYDAGTLMNGSNERIGHNSYRLLSGRITDTWRAHERLQWVWGYELNYEYACAPDLFATGSATHTACDQHLFAQGECRLGEHLLCVAGARLTQHPGVGVHFAPKLSLMYTAGSFRFRAGVSNGFKAPSLKTRYYDFYMPDSYYLKGNPGLQPESAWYESLSAEYLTASWRLSVTAWHNNITGRIAGVEYIGLPDYPGGLLQYENVARAFIRGVNAAGYLRCSRYFNLSANYALADTEDGSTGQPLNGTSRHSFTGSAIFRCPDFAIGRQALPASWCVVGRMASPRLYQSVNRQGIPEGTGTKAMAVWRLVYTQQFPGIWRTQKLSLQLGIDNLFNRTDPAVAVTPGRTCFAALSIDW